VSRLLLSVAVLAGVALTACGSHPAGAPHVAVAPQRCPGTTVTGDTDGAGPAQVNPAAVGTAAFAGHGRLAFVSSGRLYVLDGSAPRGPASLHAVAAPAGATAPAWSPDGRWLAFIVAPPSPYPVVSTPSGTLWLAGADGTGARPVLANAGPFAWSPATDVLAATVTNPVTGRTEVCDFRPGTTPRLLPGVEGRAVWSPDGRLLAFTAIQYRPQTGFAGSELETVLAAGGTPVVRARSAQDALLMAGWWPDGRGLLAWADPQSSASIAADGLAVLSYPLSGARPVTLGTTLPRPPFVVPATPWNEVAMAAGGDRVLWDDSKTITLCGETGGCTGFPAGTPGPVNLDPAWAGLGVTLAFVHGSASAPSPPGFGQAAIAAWYKTRRLWVYTLTGGNPHLISGAGTGIAAPTWSADGRFILYVRDNGLWLINPFAGHSNPSPGLPSQTGGPALRIVSKLFAGTWPNYYGYIDWQDQFAWHS
jgi:Tol biopolymer transport system component